MSYCRNCGAELSEGVAYCPKCGARVEVAVRVALAGWGERFVAWVIDMITIGVFLLPLKFVVWVAWPSFSWAPQFLRWVPFVDFGLDNVIYFLYWMFLEGTNGQSIGKMVMKIRVTGMNGEPADLARVAIESVGKAFLLPLDCIIGWIIYPKNKQRLFNYLSETIIVRA